MKYILLICFVVFSVILVAQTPQAPAQGSGTIDDPFQIASFDNLLWIRHNSGYWGLHYIQTANIDASSSVLLDSGAGWVPIGGSSPWFTGTYDGQGYEIQGLYFSRGTTFYTGLFGYSIGAKLNRIHLRDVNMFGSIYIGGLTGVAQSSIINNCSITGSVRGNSDVGGLVGFANYSTIITNSYSQATVQGNDNVGGFVGQNGFDNGYVYRCYSTGQVIAGATIYKGGFVGRQSGGSVNDSYWDTQSSGMATDWASTPRTTFQMKTMANYIFWNFANVWSIQEGTSYPNLALTAAFTIAQPLNLGNLTGSGTPGDPYIIDNASKLNVIRQSLDSCYKLNADIDLSDTVVWDYGQGWLPIGSSVAPFTGVLDGNGYRINNLVINRPQSSYCGLFAYTQNALISHLGLSDVHVLTKNYSGSLIGSAVGGNIDDVSQTGIMLVGGYSGGIVGYLNSGTLQNSRAQLTLQSPSDNLGGLVGVLTSSGAISGTVENCYSTGSLKAGWDLGGLVGYLAWGYVNNSYSHMSINGGRAIGGVVGYAGGTNPGNIYRCYGTGLIELTAGGSFEGGVVGYLNDGSTVVQSFWDIQTTGIPNNSFNGGRTTAQMTYPGSVETFSAWDFTSVWRNDSLSAYNNGYPYLAWQDSQIPDAVQSVSITQAEDSIQISWLASAGATGYKIYASGDPYAPLSQWTLIGQSTEVSFNTPAGSGEFFLIRAFSD